MMSWGALVASALLLAVPSAVHAFRAPRSPPTRGSVDEQLELFRLKQYSFEDFVKDYHRRYEPGTPEWNRREQIFMANRAKIVSFQEEKARSWSMDVNRFADYTEEEYKRMLGWKGHRSLETNLKLAERHTSFLRSVKTLPEDYSTLRSTPNSLSTVVRDQGACGSCWAEAATTVLEGHLEVNASLLNRFSTLTTQSYQTLSSQTVVSCTPNPNKCGGSGACSGATVELAYDMVKERGVPLAHAWNYESGNGNSPECKESVFDQPRLRITNYEILPRNKQQPLLEALVQSQGPIAVSVAAGHWSFYQSGIYDRKDFTINHAVTLVAYQRPNQEESVGWYKVKNSWGRSWGEDGYIRVAMTDNEDELCGWDHQAHDGIACEGDPDDTWVCGTSGILYDSVYPTGLYLAE